jgi:hypothetical protein
LRPNRPTETTGRCSGLSNLRPNETLFPPFLLQSAPVFVHGATGRWRLLLLNLQFGEKYQQSFGPSYLFLQRARVDARKISVSKPSFCHRHTPTSSENKPSGKNFAWKRVNIRPPTTNTNIAVEFSSLFHSVGVLIYTLQYPVSKNWTGLPKIP